MIKKLLLLALLAISGVFMLYRPEGQSKSTAYYAGDAYEYNRQLYVATANSGSAEIFRLNGKTLEPMLKFKPIKEAGMLTDTFNDIVLLQEVGRLYAYASSGNILYKYDVTDFSSPQLVGKVVDNSWDWYGRLDRLNGHLVTIGSKGVKIWSEDMVNTDNYAVSNVTNPYNIRLSEDNKFIFNIKGDSLDVFDRQYRAKVRGISLIANNAAGNRRLAYDQDANMIYVIDDVSLKQIGLTGDIYKTLKHDSKFGYDAVLSDSGDYLYISNGSSVAKLNKRNFKFENAFENRDLKIDGSWAMGIDVVASESGERVVVFNNSNITVLDRNLNVLAVVKSGTSDIKELAKAAKPTLSIDKSHAAVYSEVAVRGAGYWPNEEVVINFADRVYRATTDKDGGFLKVLPVPAVNVSRVDIKAVGSNSSASYSLSFGVDR